MTDKEQAQIDQDRRTLKRGALIAGVAGLGGLALLKYSKGGIKRNTPSYPGGGKGLSAPAPRAPSGRGSKVARTREVIRLPQRGVVKGGAVLGPKPPTLAEQRAALGPKLGPAVPTPAERAGMVFPKKPTALDNQTRKGGVKRAVQAANLREQRAYGALKPPTQARLAKVKPADRETYAAMDARARSKKFPSNSAITGKEASMADRGARQVARQELLKFRQQKNFMTPASRLIDFKERDRGDTARDIAVGGGALASGGGAIYAARKFGKTSEAATAAADTVRQTAARFTPKEIANAVGAEVTAKTRKTLKSYFPTFIKGGKRVSAMLKKSFATPASRMIEFNNGNQVRDPDNHRYNDPLKVTAGFQRGYTRKDPKTNQPLVHGVGSEPDMPILHAQVIKSAYNKGKKIQRTASRGGALVKDVSDTVLGKPRAKDAAGRTKKKEWEKSWFKEGAKNAAVGAGLVGGAAYLRKNPDKRAALQKGVGKATNWVNKRVPDLFKAFEEREFATPASGLFTKAEKVVRKTTFGKFLGPSAQAVKVQAQREALGKRIKATTPKAAATKRRVARDAALKKDVINNAVAGKKAAIRSVKKSAVIAGGGALAGGALMKAHADQPEDRKVHQGARLRNALVGAAAGSFLGGGLAGGASGFKGARIGAALGGVAGLLTNPKRRVAIDELQTASFETPASRLIAFGDGMEKRFKKVVKNPETGRTKTVRYGQAGKASDGKDRIRPGTSKGDAYCARSAKIKGDWQSDPNSPNNLSRKKWKCSGSVSRTDLATPASRLIEFGVAKLTGDQFKAAWRHNYKKLKKLTRGGKVSSQIGGYLPGDGMARYNKSPLVWRGTNKGEVEKLASGRFISKWENPNFPGKKRTYVAGGPDLAAGYARTASAGSRTGQGADSFRGHFSPQVKPSDAVDARIIGFSPKVLKRADGKIRSYVGNYAATAPIRGGVGASEARSMLKPTANGKGWKPVPLGDIQKKEFATPASRLIHFDGYAADAGWDIRDPRGKSARVFAPGSRQRVRRPKEWYEKSDNERKLWKAGLLVAGVAGLAGGAAVGRRFPKAPKAAVSAGAKAAAVDPEVWPAWRRA